jgi:hypothetical protein
MGLDVSPGGIVTPNVEDCPGYIGDGVTISERPKKFTPINNKGGVGIKHDFNKPQMSLLPLKDLEGVVRVLEHGVEKYARGDWRFVENGAFRYLDAGLRHAAEISNSSCIEDLRALDHDSGLPAIDHAICSLIFARHFIFKEESKEELF